jgi:hypothetical protein
MQLYSRFIGPLENSYEEHKRITHKGGNSIPVLEIEPASDENGSRVVSALREVSVIFANPSPSSGNWKSRENLASLVRLAGKLVGQDFVI